MNKIFYNCEQLSNLRLTDYRQTIFIMHFFATQINELHYIWIVPFDDIDILFNAWFDYIA